MSIQRTVEFVVYLNVGKYSRDLIFGALAVYFYFDVSEGLSLFIEQVNDIDAAATTQSRQYHLHGAHSQVVAADGW